MSDLEQLLAQPIGQLRERFLTRGRPVPEGLLEALEQDERRAAHELARTIRARREKNRSEGQRLRNLLRHEVELWEAGHLHVAGVDEAGMAPLAGPVVAAAVILPRNYRLRGIDDSKVLDAETRERMAHALKRDAVAWSVGVAQVEEIDRINIYHAGLLAMRRALLGLTSLPTFVLVDARRIPECPVPQRGIIHGDALSLTIAAASVIAKTTRDAHMAELDAQYPGYGFAAHKGYPTPQHETALRTLGACPVHRRSFAPVRQALGLDPVQELLFEPPPVPPEPAGP
ncbi:MAG TPA: ribonuclease HII [Myxococcaceae bacterium]|nr:ribonuclease HII [Myxococcaceae bacterium]